MRKSKYRAESVNKFIKLLIDENIFLEVTAFQEVEHRMQMITNFYVRDSDLQIKIFKIFYNMSLDDQKNIITEVMKNKAGRYFTSADLVYNYISYIILSNNDSNMRLYLESRNSFKALTTAMKKSHRKDEVIAYYFTNSFWTVRGILGYSDLNDLGAKKYFEDYRSTFFNICSMPEIKKDINKMLLKEKDRWVPYVYSFIFSKLNMIKYYIPELWKHIILSGSISIDVFELCNSDDKESYLLRMKDSKLVDAQILYAKIVDNLDHLKDSKSKTIRRFVAQKTKDVDTLIYLLKDEKNKGAVVKQALWTLNSLMKGGCSKELSEKMKDIVDIIDEIGNEAYPSRQLIAQYVRNSNNSYDWCSFVNREYLKDIINEKIAFDKEFTVKKF